VNPTRVVVDETRRSFAYLSLYGVATDAVLVNRVLPQAASGGYFARWAEHERRELAEIESSFPVPIFHAPLRSSEPIGVDALRALARDMFGERDPAALFAHGRPIRLQKTDARTCLEIDLPNATRDEIDVTAIGDELLVRVRDAQRRIALPASVAGRSVAAVRLVRGVLAIEFGP
jgi:arsenite-transporting ATPase